MNPNKTPQQYWKRNLRLLYILFSIWFIASYGCGIIFAEELNNFRLGGYKLGFWFAQQGSIYIFILIIFVYAALMNKLDKEFEVDE
jgi:putative solute:sodium symporter small subunit